MSLYLPAHNWCVIGPKQYLKVGREEMEDFKVGREEMEELKVDRG